MSRDYANRKASGAKPRAPKKKSAPKAKASKFSLGSLLVVFLLLAGFGYFLWTINGSAGNTGTEKAKETKTAVKNTATAQKVVKKTKPKKDLNALPPKPTEEWTYLKELENKSVDVDVPAEALVSAGPYQMQCASFRQESQANQMKAMIAFQGLNAQVRQVNGTSGTWFKVILGPYDNKRAAEKHKHIMQNARLNGCQIMLM